LAYRRSTDDLFAAAYTKQMTGYKPGGSTGAIYLIHNVATTPTIGSSPFVDLNTLFGANTAGANPHTTTNNYNPDTSTFDAVGKIGLGGLAVSEDDSTLYAMNLANKSLYSIPIGAPPAAVSAPAAASITTTALPTPADCTASDMRPFAVTVYRNLVYVGAICSAQSTVVAGTLPYGNLTKLHAYVFVYTPGTGFTSTPVFEIPLNYTRHCAWESGSPPGSTGCNAAAWQAWQSDWSTAYTRGGTDPQPMLTSLAFDNGNLLLGLRDRMGDEGGSGMTGGYSPPIPGGDILRACLNTAGSPLSGWTLENNAVCGTTTITAGQSNGKGPGNGEYYYQQNYATTHDYTALGGLAQIPGNTTVMSTVFDPVSAFFTGGERTYSNSAGTQSTAYEIYNSNTTTTTFGKANGLGALVPLCQSAPIEVGDRVWNDANGNGIQDPGEAGISGATVHLYASNGTTLISTTTTDSTGSYYFTLPASYTAYVIKLDNATDYASGGVLYHLRLTLADKDTTNHLTDSKATLPTPTSAIGTSNYPTIAVASHTPGQNDHSFDIGLTQAPDFFAGKTSALSYGNLALAATPTASSTLTAGGWALSAVNDGQLTSTGSSMGWTSNATLTTNHTEWIQLDLGASYSIQAINLYPRNDAGNVGYGFPMDFTITTSTDGTFWTTLVSKTGYALPNAVQMFTFSTQDARYVLITGTNLRSNPNDANKYRMQFAEITIY